mgnify:CR=1 FL=1
MRAGLWANSVAVNDCFQLGTMLPQVDWAVNKAKIAVIVMNPNFNNDPITGAPIPQSGSMASHALHVWEKYIALSGFKNLKIIAHSAGGYCLNRIICENKAKFYK